MNEEERRKFREALKSIFSDRLERAEEKGRREGWKNGNYEGIEETEVRVAAEMLKYGEPIEKIIKYSRLDEDEILDLAAYNGLQIIY